MARKRTKQKTYKVSPEEYLDITKAEQALGMSSPNFALLMANLVLDELAWSAIKPHAVRVRVKNWK